jgi:hypothetical protein
VDARTCAPLKRVREDIALLRALLGSERFWEIAEATDPVARAYDTPDELALAACLFECRALLSSEDEATAARWDSLRQWPHRAHDGWPERKGE